MRKVLIILLIAFLVYFLFSNPEGLAGAISDIGDFFVNFFDAIIEFFSELF